MHEGAVAIPSFRGIACLAQVFLGQVHGVVDQDVRIRRQRAKLGIHDGVVLGVGCIDDRVAVVIDAIGKDAIGVIAPGILDADFLVFAQLDHLSFLQIMKAHLSAHIGEVDREARIVHLASEGLLEGMGDVIAAVHVKAIALDERGREKGKALDVIPMHVAEKDMGDHRTLIRQALSEQAHAGAAVQDDQGLAAPHLDTARVPSDLDCVRTRNRDASTNTPEFDEHSGPLLILGTAARAAPSSKLACVIGLGHSSRQRVGHAQTRMHALASTACCGCVRSMDDLPRRKRPPEPSSLQERALVHTGPSR